MQTYAAKTKYEETFAAEQDSERGLTHGLPNSDFVAAISAASGAASAPSDPDLLSKIKNRQSHIPGIRQAQIPTAEREADSLASGVGSGMSSPEAVRAEMESRLGADLSGVRFHTGSAAEGYADSIGARAYTTGKDIYFGSGGFDPGVAAHELVHTAQQGAAQAAVPTVAAPMGGIQMKAPGWLRTIGRGAKNAVTAPFKALGKLFGGGGGGGGNATATPKTPKAPKEPKAPKLSKDDEIIASTKGDTEEGADKLHGAHTRKTAAWMDSLTPEEREAVGIYTGGDYMAINKTLRGSSDAGTYRNMTTADPKVKTQEGVEQVASTLSAALGKNRTQSDMTVYRGVKTDFVQYLFSLLDPENTQRLGKNDEGGASAYGMEHDKDKLTGLEFGDKGFSSTSIDQSVAKGFATMQHGGYDAFSPENLGHLLHINVPKGSKGAYVDPLSSKEGEKEFLLDRNSRFKVSKVDSDGAGRLQIFLDLLEDLEEGQLQ